MINQIHFSFVQNPTKLIFDVTKYTLNVKVHDKEYVVNNETDNVDFLYRAILIKKPIQITYVEENNTYNIIIKYESIEFISVY